MSHWSRHARISLKEATMMDNGMSSMMGWMTGSGLLGWVLVIALLVTIVILLAQLVRRTGRRDPSDPPPPGRGPGEAHR
jgi:uncharacterized membrane protein